MTSIAGAEHSLPSLLALLAILSALLVIVSAYREGRPPDER